MAELGEVTAGGGGRGVGLVAAVVSTDGESASVATGVGAAGGAGVVAAGHAAMTEASSDADGAFSPAIPSADAGTGGAACTGVSAGGAAGGRGSREGLRGGGGRGLKAGSGRDGVAVSVDIEAPSSSPVIFILSLLLILSTPSPIVEGISSSPIIITYNTL